MSTRIRTLYDLAGSDTIDSRQLIARLRELDEDDYEELAALRAINDEGEQNFPDWTSGETLIRDSYFTTYAQELAEDIGAISSNAQWPLGYIDWDAAADALKMDYSTIEIDGTTYYGRA